MKRSAVYWCRLLTTARGAFPSLFQVSGYHMWITVEDG